MGLESRIATKPRAFRLLKRRRQDLTPLREWTGAVPGHLQTDRSLRAKTRVARTHKGQISRLDPLGDGVTPLHLNLSRKAGVSSMCEPNPRSRLVRTGPCSKFDVGQNTSSRATIQAVFLTVFEGVPIWTPITTRQRCSCSETGCGICHSDRTSRSNG